MSQLNSLQTRHYAITRPIFSNRRRGFRTVSTTVRALLLRAVLWALLFVFSANLFAATLDLRSVSVPDLSRIVFKEMLKADYVLSPEVISSESKLSLLLSNQSKESIVDTLRNTLAMAGFSLVKRGNVFYVSKAVALQPETQQAVQAKIEQGADVEFYTYKCKARPLAYITKLAHFSGANVIEGDLSGDVLVFSASLPIKQRLEAILRVVDVPAQAITIRAALIEFSDTQDKGRSFALTVLSNKIGATYNAGAALANSVIFSGVTLQAALSAIDGDSRFLYLSQPMLRVLDGESARLSVGSDVPVRGAVTIDKNGNSLQSVEYHSSGVILDVTPKIVGDLITLKIDQQISSFGVTTTSNIDSPSLNKRQASTVIDVRKGQLIALAGLDEYKDTNTQSGLSFLPDWMRSHSTNKAKSQILLLLEVLEDKAL